MGTPSQNNLSLIVNAQDANGVNFINRVVGAIGYQGIVGQYLDGVLTTTGSTSLTLPTATALQVYIKNTSATAGITIGATPSSGSSGPIGKLGPGSVYTYWSMTFAASLGFTAMTLTADTAGATFELFLGG